MYKIITFYFQNAILKANNIIVENNCSSPPWFISSFGAMIDLIRLIGGILIATYDFIYVFDAYWWC